MAAKQGLTAQLSQAGEDAKRAVLSRTVGVTSSSWFSNLNTVCTIKSAPPRSPDVLQMLSTKSGWLFKRNEQHVWQARWCCVVPHSFLYYFDAVTAPGGATAAAMVPTAEQQAEWNQALLENAGRRPHEKRSNFYLFAQQQQQGDTTNNNESSAATATTPQHVTNTDDDDELLAATPNHHQNQHPAGIIDLECYTHVHRSRSNARVLELAGDDQVNPDLRAFYFTALTQDDSDAWSDALLHDRHSRLQDECDAYKQVCDGFAQQLQSLHASLDGAQSQVEQAREELYQVRSASEDARRTVWNMVQEFAEVGAPAVVKEKEELHAHVERVKQHDLGVPAVVQLLCEYTTAVETKLTQVSQVNESLQADLQMTGQTDQQQAQDLQAKLDILQSTHEDEKKAWQTQMDALTNKYQMELKERQDVQKNLTSTRMEMTMFQSQQKNKTSLLQEHKRILKKEVIELRQKLDVALSELSTLKHQHENSTVLVQQEQEKAKLLERYVEKIESQVKVQQNMMEMMSQSGVGSVFGSAARSITGDHRGIVLVRNDTDPDECIDVAQRLVPMHGGDSGRRPSRRTVMDDDNKSHMSELTEDRTQRHFDNYQDASPRQTYRNHYRENSPRRLPPTLGPPSYILGATLNSPDTTTDTRDDSKQSKTLETIRGRSSASLPPGPSTSSSRPNPRKLQLLPRSNSGRQLSVAQRARLEADRGQTTPVRVRAASHDSQSQPSSAKLWRRMEEAVLGPRPEDIVFTSSDEDNENDDASKEGDNDNGHPQEEKKTLDTDSVVVRLFAPSIYQVSNTNFTYPTYLLILFFSLQTLSIKERAQLQRAKQLEFLKKQGLIKDDSDVASVASTLSKLKVKK
jgi:hypothetical protein